MLRRILVWGLLLSVVGMTPNAQASFSNGDFSSDLTGWTSQGDVTVVGGAAAVGDTDATTSALYQPVAWPDASFTLEFDFRNDLSPDFSSGNTFPDTFFASVYFTDDPGTFSTQPGGFDSAVGLFDLDASGAFNVNGTIGASTLGFDWSHFSVTLPNTSPYIVPYFELNDLNFVNADSTVYLDNFLLVPEPGTLTLCLTGTLLLLARRRNFRA